eukprot:comp16898_c0_seq2/m.27639 comp16898_c0_seq2/g.27639  ORF comp16898_c0_seq2/g.27639 comp16898_c0_seq2/m.27639 type:complete len:430 (-) comp16898_c0_seq2:29-1318(-)
MSDSGSVSSSGTDYSSDESSSARPPLRLRAMADDAKKSINRYTATGVEKAQVALDRTLDEVSRKAVDVIVDSSLGQVKEMIKDDDMPHFVKRLVDSSVDEITPMIKEEIANGVVLPLVRLRAEEPEEVPLRPCPNFPMWLRARILYALFPYDRGIWQQLRDPFWYLMMAILNFPQWAVHPIAFTLIFLISDLRDEYTLIQYILTLKATSFIGQGLIPLSVGAVWLYACSYHYDGISTCSKDGPFLESWELVPFLVQVVLVWLATFLLPFSHRKAHVYRFPRPEEIDNSSECCGCCTVHSNRGQKIYWWVLYDAIVFIGCMSVAIWYYTMRDHLPMWVIEGTFYWLKVLYGMLSIPWIIFSLPLMATIFTKARPTGYDRAGNVRLTIKPRKKTIAKAETQIALSDPEVSDKYKFWRMFQRKPPKNSPNAV